MVSTVEARTPLCRACSTIGGRPSATGQKADRSRLRLLVDACGDGMRRAFENVKCRLEPLGGTGRAHHLRTVAPVARNRTESSIVDAAFDLTGQSWSRRRAWRLGSNGRGSE
jgi:hypothetical protein